MVRTALCVGPITDQRGRGTPSATGAIGGISSSSSVIRVGMLLVRAVGRKTTRQLICATAPWWWTRRSPSYLRHISHHFIAAVRELSNKKFALRTELAPPMLGELAYGLRPP